jgi:hypothetical protein
LISDEEGREVKDKVSEAKFSYLQILTNFRAMLSLVSAVAILVMTLFYDGIIGPRFLEIGVPKDIIGYLFGS